MRAPHEITGDLKTLLDQSFQTVLITTAQISEQFLSEVRAISSAALPAVVIVYEGYSNSGGVSETQLALVLIDEFRADDQDKAVSVLTALSTLSALFPATGLALSGVMYFPSGAQAASADKAYACFALSLTAKQGST